MPLVLSAIGQLFLVGSLLFIILCIFFVLFFMKFHKNQANLILEKRSIEFGFQEQLLRTQLEIQEQTLLKITQEIHDNIGQTLSLAKLNLNTLGMDDDQTKEGKISNTRELVGKAITDLRSLSKTLNADSIVSAGLLKAIDFELGQIEKTGAFETSMEVTGEVNKLHPQKELILFRIVQECLNNIIKHSEATSINVLAHFSPSELQLEIIDNGKGFNMNHDQVTMESGLGLRNMKSRAALIGGNLSIESQLNHGTKITVTIPINE
jgi:signal transduction histidine kinase